MPEGEAIHRTAAALRTALVGRAVLSFEAPRLDGPMPAAGRVIELVESHGDLEPGQVLADAAVWAAAAERGVGV